jgi:hypothetical protein
MRNEIGSGTRPDATASDGGSATIALKHTVARLLQLLDRETAALRKGQPVDMDDLSNRKNQALLELSRIGRRVEPDTVDDQLRSMLAELRGKLDENQSVLKLHLQAVGEVADILATAIRDAESDGTYSTGGYSRYLA